MVDPERIDYYQADPVRIPITSTALMRIHNEPYLNGNNSLRNQQPIQYGALPEPKNQYASLLPQYKEPPQELPNTQSQPNNQLQGDNSANNQQNSNPTADDEKPVHCKESDALKEGRLDADSGAIERFVKGVMDGLKQQATSFLELLKIDFGEVAEGVQKLIQKMKDDYAGTIAAIVEAIGGSVADQLDTLVKCGSYDRGYFIGENIEPAKIAKVITNALKFTKNIHIGPSKKGDHNGDGHVDTRDNQPDVKDTNHNGKLDEPEYAKAGVKDVNKDGDLNEADANILCKLQTPGKKPASKSSFPAGTLIHTKEGLKPIEQLKVGDEVLAQHPVTMELAYKKITQLYQRRTDDIWVIRFNTGNGVETIEATSQHPFNAQGEGWVEAVNLNVGVHVITVDGVAEVERLVPAGSFQQVYNFSVEDWNNYFVGETGFWVHNSVKRNGSDCPKGGDGSAHQAKGDSDLPDNQTKPNRKQDDDSPNKGLDGSPALKDDPYHPDKVADRQKDAQDFYGNDNSKPSTNNGYTPPPKTINGIPDLSPAKPKTPVQGGGGLRKRWKDKDGNIYEWDSQHGALEKYNKRGKHLGEFDPNTGAQTKPANPNRKVEP